MRRFRNISALRSADDGTAMLEAALVIPLLIALTLGVMGFGMVYKDLATAQKSIRAATRYLSRLPVSRLCSTAGQDEARKIAVYGDPNANTSTAIPVISNWTISRITVTLDPACPGTPSTTPVDRRIRLTAEVPPNMLAWSNITMRPSHEERWIGQ